MVPRIWLAAGAAASGLAVVACGAAAVTAPATSKPAATRAQLLPAILDYRACGLDVLTTAAQADCVTRLLSRLDAYSYAGTPGTAELYDQARAAGTAFQRCWTAAARYDASACDGTQFYTLLTQLVDAEPA